MKKRQAVVQQAAPIKTGGPGMHDLVRADIRARLKSLDKDMIDRKAFGLQKYGRMLQAFNGRNPLVDSLQEQLDDIVYTKQAMIEWDAMVARIKELEAGLDEVQRMLCQNGFQRGRASIAVGKLMKKRHFPASE